MTIENLNFSLRVVIVNVVNLCSKRVKLSQIHVVLTRSRGFKLGERVVLLRSVVRHHPIVFIS